MRSPVREKTMLGPPNLTFLETHERTARVHGKRLVKACKDAYVRPPNILQV